ncbi:Yip1 family protein [Kineobactrum salinum]|uniref:YIP1 family protein n=1 Tax=Kineobactrum salinum TaxID=2708301 RepID=A0A6C0TYN6_9GAMM|nr:Yip1 family protein [Kineobactrum salinum]QIB64499.1 YIP1 family protein [Kineobactrum salinum]
MIQHSIGLMTRPRTQWQRVAALPSNSLTPLLLYPGILALLPAVAWYYGTSRVGWSIGGSEAIRLTAASALQLCVLFYFAMLACVAAVGYFIYWMAGTYGARTSVVRGIVVAGLTVTPLFLFGLAGFYPLLWVDLLLGVIAVSWSVYLLYVGIPIMMEIPEERGFMFSTAVIAVGLVILVSLMVSTVILWDLGIGPAYTDA